MTFFEQLQEATSADRARLLSAPVIADCLAGCVSRETYGEFLIEAYHHVKHTVPLLMACGSRIPERLEWLREGVAAYIEEEYGHEQWILSDLETLGWKRSTALARRPRVETELMVAYAHDTVWRNNPAGLLGMVFVLEGTSVAIATRAAEIIGKQLDLPRRAFSYLLSHGSLDAAHIGHLENLLNRFEDDADQAAVLHCAHVMYRLYGDIFRALPRVNVPAASSHQAGDTKEAA
jgi:hypothetical protein